MKRKVTVNIDTVELSVNGERNGFNILDAKIANVISPEGELLNSYQNRMPMPEVAPLAWTVFSIS